ARRRTGGLVRASNAWGKLKPTATTLTAPILLAVQDRLRQLKEHEGVQANMLETNLDALAVRAPVAAQCEPGFEDSRFENATKLRNGSAAQRRGRFVVGKQLLQRPQIGRGHRVRQGDKVTHFRNAAAPSVLEGPARRVIAQPPVAVGEPQDRRWV